MTKDYIDGEHSPYPMPHAHRFIDPRTLAAIKDLPLIARTVVDGFMYGGHQSRTAGMGLEFNQYRSYQPGDDLRRVDWKLYARSDRFYVRESEVETSVSVRFVLDASASMLHTEEGVAKFDYARFLVAALAFLASRQGDAVGFFALREGRVDALEPRRGPQHLHRLLHSLEGIAAGGVWPAWTSVEQLFTVAVQRDLVIFITDLHEQGEEIRTVLAKVRAMKNEVLLFHLLGRREIDFSYEGVLELEDLETGRVVEVDPERVRRVYRIRMEEHLLHTRQALQDFGVSYTLFTLDQPLDFALRTYLAQRARSG